MLSAFALAFAIGFVTSLPVTGPIAVGILALGLAGHHREAMGVAGGAALGETMWAALAFAGVATAFARWPTVAFAGGVMGGLAVIALGILLVARGAPNLEGLAPTGGGSVALGLGAVLANVALPLQWSAACAAVARWMPTEWTAAAAFGVGAGLGVWGGYAALLTLVRRRPVSGPTADRLVRVCGGWLVLIGGGMAVRAWA